MNHCVMTQALDEPFYHIQNMVEADEPDSVIFVISKIPLFTPKSIPGLLKQDILYHVDFLRRAHCYLNPPIL